MAFRITSPRARAIGYVSSDVIFDIVKTGKVRSWVSKMLKGIMLKFSASFEGDVQ